MSATAILDGSPVELALRTLIVFAGILASLASVIASSSTVLPDIVPENDPAVKTPELGLYVNPESVSIPSVPPVAPSTNVRYVVSSVELLAVTVTLVASVAVVAVVAFPVKAPSNVVATIVPAVPETTSLVIVASGTNVNLPVESS